MSCKLAGGIVMPELHARGVVLVVELLDAADHIGRLKPEDVAELLRETADVLGELLKRDIPRRPAVD
jgi:hypothetical protein